MEEGSGNKTNMLTQGIISCGNTSRCTHMNDMLCPISSETF